MLVSLLENQFFWVLVLTVYVFGFTYSAKFIYNWMIGKGLEREQAVYYNRKLVHIFAGGVVVLLVPFVFRSPWFPLFCGMMITVFTLVSHWSDHMMYWFQTEKNWNDVSFCFMWGVTVFGLWVVLDNPWIAVIPPAFMAIGDGITGIIRSFVFERRTKHFIGNVWMAAFCIPIGFYLGHLAGNGMIFWGPLSGVFASVVERYEIGPVDDNILITVVASVVLLFGAWVGPVF